MRCHPTALGGMAATLLLLHAVGAAAATATSAAAFAAAKAPPSLTIEADTFLLDGKPLQIISGSMHYFRIHPDYWEDRLERAAAMGLNTVEVYIPWNFHEPYPGEYLWRGWADVERWLQLIQDQGMWVVLRPGPYICAEWDFGGFPWWLASSAVSGGGTMRMRTSDPAYLAHVDHWWAQLFPRLRRFLLEEGGPVLMVQMENEYGFCGEDKEYLRHLVNTTRQHLSQDALLFTTDPPGVAARGTLNGSELYTVVDFGPGWFAPDAAFGVQRSLNAPGKSPPFCSEFYSGWLTHWGEPMANTSTDALLRATQTLLEYANSTGSLSFYMAHGGTNFGFWAGAGIDGTKYLAHITSYDYDCPISEAGDYCQPGIGGACKYTAIRDLIARHTGRSLPEPPPRPAVHRYGTVELRQEVPLWEALPQLLPGGPGGIAAEQPSHMEEYGQRWGLILYRTHLKPGALDQEGKLDLGGRPGDYASVFIAGQLAGRLDRSQPETALTLPAQGHGGSGDEGFQLDILVEGMGRVNFGCDQGGWDHKGLTSSNVTLNGEGLTGWEVFPLALDDLDELEWGKAATVLVAAARRRLTEAPSVGSTAVLSALRGGDQGGGGDAQVPLFLRGTFEIDDRTALRGSKGFLADSFLSTHGWGKGLAWVNGFALGWYWPSQGPQMTLYVPGPVLRAGNNEVLLLELEHAPDRREVLLDDTPDFYGPSSKPTAAGSAAAAHPAGARRHGAHGPA
ncbi:Beta-galactosidase 17 [Micractinium conductrix]|uniref:Beta-galactosidase n=1 Tax=Micractinium conductrix TaxID=554055 RepID=A0A2P6V0S3_9CHLO|nr:Beta-galactosidase 17 [Micractinium conductrix]|eukprot:PSC67692.1 Beta-galactosidase 17 [Micractinium conductrix]